MIPHWLVDGRTVRVLTRFIVGAAVVFGLGLLVCLGRLYLTANQAKTADAATAAAQTELADVEQKIAEAKLVRQSNAPGSNKAVASFQASAQSLAAKHGAAISELTVTPEVQTYLSKFTNDAPPKGWSQVALRFTLSGRAQDVIGMLDGLRGTDIPMEFDDIEINRTSWDEISGEAKVTALVQLRVLMRA